MKEIFPDKDTRSFDTTLREFTSRVKALGGDEDTVITIEADGEPVYVYCYPKEKPVPDFVRVFTNVSEEGEPYGEHDNLEDALKKLLEFPNDLIEVRLKRKS